MNKTHFPTTRLPRLPVGLTPMNWDVKMPYSSVHTYYARMYEAEFLTGAIAAAVSRIDKLGYARSIR